MGYCEMIFVVYMGGAAGDVVASVIDHRNSKFNSLQRRMEMPLDRQRLKKPHTFESDAAKDEYVQQMSATYRSLPSHDIDYHVHNRHTTIGITVQDTKIANWAAKRFESVHRPQVWQQVCEACGITNTRQYADLMLHYSNMLEKQLSNTIKLERIVAGNLVEDLESVLGEKLDQKSVNVYRNWLDLVNGRFIV